MLAATGYSGERPYFMDLGNLLSLSRTWSLCLYIKQRGWKTCFHSMGCRVTPRLV